ncbi:MAG TPA: S8 family serine peptidase [Streptosporangiaceae bacterium]|nr:S8 family serine peptidase [Streptosporangiaceae bacterium]
MLTWSGSGVARVAVATTATALGLTLPLAAGLPAKADIVRQRQMWVLNTLNVPAAWRASQGHGVVVAVIDSGVDPSVSDLSGSVISGPDLTGVHTLASNPNWGAHGTWMASLIAGHGHGHGGDDGVLGVAPQAKILSIRVITDRSDPGYNAFQEEPPGRGQRGLATAIRYAVSHKAKVISMSLGYNAPSLVVRRALQYALTRNVVVVASSGNSGDAQESHGHGQAPYSFPADYPGVIGVAAISQSGQPAYFSSDNLSVQVAAPGVGVPAQGRGSQYWVVSGTSPACALTAGVAALIKARYPGLTAPQVRRAIVVSASHRPPGGYDDQIGFGTVDAAAALRSAHRLADRHAATRLTPAKMITAGFFGGGRAAVPPVPVPPRGRTSLELLMALAAACLLLAAVSSWRFATGLAARRKARRQAACAPPLPHAAYPAAPPYLPRQHATQQYQADQRYQAPQQYQEPQQYQAPHYHTPQAPEYPATDYQSLSPPRSPDTIRFWPPPATPEEAPGDHA